MKIVTFVLVVFTCFNVQAQRTVSLDEAVAETLQKNKNIQAAALDIDYQRQMKRTSTDIGKTNVMYMRGQYNSYFKDDNNITITQSIPFPTVFTSQNTLGRSLIRGSELQKAVTENEMVYQVKQVYYHLLYLTSKEKLLHRQDSIFENLVKAADLRFRTGESRLLEKATAETQRDEARNNLAQTRADIVIYETMLQTLMNSETRVNILRTELIERTLNISSDTSSLAQNPQLAYLRQQVEIAGGEKKVATAKFLPDFTVGYFNQTLISTPRNASGEIATKSDRFSGFQVGIAVPLWFGPQTARVKATAINQQKSKAQYEYNETLLQGQWQQAVQEYSKNKMSVDYYRSSALQNAELILKQSDLAFRNGEIEYTEYWLSLRNAFQIRDNYLNNLNNLNQSALNLEFLAGTR
jgi:heavy metal efflux system protein